MESSTEASMSSISESISNTATVQKSTMVSSSSSKMVTSIRSAEQIEMSLTGITDDSADGVALAEKMGGALAAPKLELMQGNKDALQLAIGAPTHHTSVCEISESVASDDAASASSLLKKSSASTDIKKSSTYMAESGVIMSSAASTTEVTKQTLITAASTTKSSSTTLTTAESIERA